jgi:hypothetical protein
LTDGSTFAGHTYLAHRPRLSRGEVGHAERIDAAELGGSYVKDGANRVIAQKTVVIPAKDGDG